MIQHKRINIIIAIAVSFALIVSMLLIIFGNEQAKSGTSVSKPLYGDKIFGTDIISIEIIADEDDWQTMLDTATSEQFIMADVIVNGTRFQNVGIRPKGNSSLSQVAQSDSNRYSFRLQFNEYVKDQTCFGLESFVVNNMLGDNTYMKEYVSYELMKETGVGAPYFGFADIRVNDESWGLYLAVELYNDSYEQRVFSDTSGMLYNVKSMDIGGGMGAGNNAGINEGNNAGIGGESNAGVNAGNANFSDIANRGNAGNFSRGGSSGGSLEYSDDNISSYSAIFGNVVGKGSDSDYERVIEALKALNEGRDLEKYFDIDQILRYLAAHTLVVNLDSYSSSMAQNYYLYEKDGQVTILPWDYNLAWGGFQSGSASSVINFPIDTPVSGVEMSARPFIEKLFENVEYLERYHSYLQELIDNYFANGKFAKKVNALDARIGAYVENDATAFCSYEEYKTAISAFITLGNLRAESVQGQLDGTVPSTTEGQTANPDGLVSAGSFNLTDLGSMMGGRGDRGNFFGGNQNENNGQNQFPGAGGNMPDMQLMQQALQLLEEAGGEITDEVREKLLELGLSEEEIAMLTNMQGGFGDGFPQGQIGNQTDTAGNFSGNNQNNRLPGQSDNNAPFTQPEVSSKLSNPDSLYLAGALVLILIGATVFAAKQKKNY